MKYKRVTLDTLAYELAPVVVSSEELEERLAPLYDKMHIQVGQLEAMTGIYERRYWEPGFKVSEGAARAAIKALAKSPVPPSEIGALIYGGVCRDGFEPATACHVAGRLEEAGLAISPSAAIHDVSNACLGVLNGMVDIANRIELGQIRAGMVVSAETAREIVDDLIERMNHAQDLETFKYSIATMTGGSGAVAIILSDGSFDEQPGHRLLGGIIEAAPEHHMLCRWGMELDPLADPEGHVGDQYRQFMRTDSVAVLDNGVELAIRSWRAFQAEMGWTVEDVDRVISHQVGSGHRSTYLKTFGLPPEKDFVAYESLGNTGTVALPLAAALANERDFLVAGQHVGLLGIGSGLNCIMLGVDW